MAAVWSSTSFRNYQISVSPTNENESSSTNSTDDDDEHQTSQTSSSVDQSTGSKNRDEASLPSVSKSSALSVSKSSSLPSVSKSAPSVSKSSSLPSVSKSSAPLVSKSSSLPSVSKSSSLPSVSKSSAPLVSKSSSLASVGKPAAASVSQSSSLPSVRSSLSVIVPDETVFKMIDNANFKEQHIHQYNLCSKEQCTHFTPQEISRQSSFKDKFPHNRISDDEAFCTKTGIWWLVFAEGAGMYCLLCRKHDTMNKMNKSKTFNLDPSCRLKPVALGDHTKTLQHRDAIETEMTSRVSIFHKEIIEKEKTSDDVLMAVFNALYWLMKEEIALTKLKSLLKLVEKMGLSSLKYFTYTGAGTEQDMFLLVGNTLADNMLNEVRGQRFGILADEVTDIAVVQQMVVFIQYVQPKTGLAKVVFLDNINVLRNSTTADAETLYKCIVEVLSRNKLNIKHCTSLVTDGASVMVGKRGGVAARLKENNPSLISIHCICHRLALSCTDTNASIKYISDVERILRQLWTFFENSPKRCAILTKVQLELNNISGNDIPKNTRKSLTKKVKKACSTRWLSFEQSVQSVYNEFVAILQTLRNLRERDPTADGLLRKMSNVKFFGVIVILRHILPKLSLLSRTFQMGNINLSSVGPAIHCTVDSLDEINESGSPLTELDKELAEGGRCQSLELKPTDHQKQELKNIMDKYVSALKSNIDNRFSESIPVLSAFEIFNPCLVPERETLTFKNYGNEKLLVLVDHFGQELSEQERIVFKEEVFASWALFKYELLNLKKNIPTEISEAQSQSLTAPTPTQWALQQILVNKLSYKAFVHLIRFVEIYLSMPVSNAWPERGASAIKRIKTRLRSSLKEDMLKSIMHVSVNGEESADVKFIQQCVSNFKAQKHRRKLPVLRVNDQKEAQPQREIEQSDVSVQTVEDMATMEAIRDKIVSITKLSSLLGIDIGTGVSESDHDDDDEDDEEADDYDF